MNNFDIVSANLQRSSVEAGRIRTGLSCLPRQKAEPPVKMHDWYLFQDGPDFFRGLFVTIHQRPEKEMFDSAVVVKCDERQPIAAEFVERSIQSIVNISQPVVVILQQPVSILTS